MGGPSFSQPFGQPYQSKYFGNQFQLKIDPKIQAEIEALRLRLQFQKLRQTWFSPDWSQLDPYIFGPLPPPDPSSPLSLTPPPTTPAFCPFKPGPPPKESRKGEAGDVLRAVWALPCVKHAVGKVQSKLERDWRSLDGTGKGLLIGQGVLIGGGLVAGIASDKAARVWVLDKLNGTDIPIPKLDGASFRIHAPNGIIKGVGGKYSHRIFEVSGDYQQAKLPSGVQFNSLSFSLKINVLEAIPPLKSVF